MEKPETKDEVQYVGLPKPVLDAAFNLLGEMPAKFGSGKVMEQINQFGFFCEAPKAADIGDVIPDAEEVEVVKDKPKDSKG